MDPSCSIVCHVFGCVGRYVIPLVDFNWTQLYLCNHRNDCRNAALSNRRILQSFKSIVLHWHLILAVRVLLHTVIRETVGYHWT